MNHSYRDVFCVLLIVSVIFAPVAAEAAWDLEDIYRKEPQRKYEGAVSFFFVHGYVTAFAQDFEKDFSTFERNGDQPLEGAAPGLIGGPGNVTLGNSGGSASFSHDVGLIIGAELNSQLKLLTEQHWVNRNVPGQEDIPFNEIATTQAKVRWQPWEDQPYRITAGRFWSSFAGAQDDLLSAQGNFTHVPNARSALPYAFNDGLQVDGAYKSDDGRVGINWVVELVNGNENFNGASGGTFDSGNNFDVSGRIGILPLSFFDSFWAQEFEVGVSYADGTLREDQGSFLSDKDPTDVNAEWDGLGVDLRYVKDDFNLRGYWIDTDEDLKGGPELERTGIMVEGLYRVLDDLGVLGAADVKLRYDKFERDGILTSAVPGATLDDARTFEDVRWTYGVNFHPMDQLKLEFEYSDSDEDGGFNEADDNGFSAALTASF